jgi:hypothetical protein
MRLFQEPSGLSEIQKKPGWKRLNVAKHIGRRRKKAENDM